MELNHLKILYLNKRMTELGLGGAFDNWFLRFPRNNPRLAPYEPAMTLKQFFACNKKFLSKPSDRFLCNADGEGFSLQSASFQKLKSFLILKGFTQTDWIMLSSCNQQGNLFPFSAQKKSEILALQFITLNLVKSKSETFQLLLRVLPKINPESITIAHVLSLSDSDIEKVTGTRGLWHLSYDRVQAFRVFITKIQAKLGSWGFTGKDGSFMVISFKKQKSVARILNRAA